MFFLCASVKIDRHPKTLSKVWLTKTLHKNCAAIPRLPKVEGRQRQCELAYGLYAITICRPKAPNNLRWPSLARRFFFLSFFGEGAKHLIRLLAAGSPQIMSGRLVGKTNCVGAECVQYLCLGWHFRFRTVAVYAQAQDLEIPGFAINHHPTAAAASEEIGCRLRRLGGRVLLSVWLLFFPSVTPLKQLAATMMP